MNILTFIDIRAIISININIIGGVMEDYKLMSEIFKAFSDENRLKIIKSLQEGEKCGCTLLEEIDIAQSTLSHHMKILVKSSIVNSRKDGKWTYYSLSDSGSSEAKKLLEDILNKASDYKTYIVCP